MGLHIHFRKGRHLKIYVNGKEIKRVVCYSDGQLQTAIEAFKTGLELGGFAEDRNFPDGCHFSRTEDAGDEL